MAVNTTWSSPATAGGSGGTDLAAGDTLSETIWDRLQSDVYRLGGTDGNAKTGPYQIGSTTAYSNAQNTAGLTVNQAAADDEIVSLKSSDVAHGITTFTETDTYGRLQKVSAADGGVQLQGFTEVTAGLLLYGAYTTDDTTKATTSRGGVEVLAAKKSGTGLTSPGANANMLVVREAGNPLTRAIIDFEGDLHLDATSNINVWDDHDDLALVEAYRLATMGAPPDGYRVEFARQMERAREVLAATRVLTLNDDGHHFVSLKGLLGLLMDTLRQEGYRLRALEARVAPLLPAE